MLDLQYIKKNYLKDALEELGFKSFTNVQIKTFEALKENRNVLVRSKTGSGKTHSFLIPIFNDLDEKVSEIQALILAPTNELAFQLFNVCKQIGSKSAKTIDIRLYDSNLNSTEEEKRLDGRQPQIVVGTPGKVHELVVKRNALKAYRTKYFVVDEADMSFEEGFQAELDDLAAIVADSRMMFFSATIHEKILAFLKKYLKNPIYIDLDDTFENKISHVWLPIKHQTRLVVLNELLKIINPYLAIVFVNKKENVPMVYQSLTKEGYNCCMLHGDMPIRERKRTVREILALKYQYIVATDIAARGIDIPGVSHVIQYELPYDYEFYVHRSGRCGRMGQTGISYALYDKLDDTYLNLLNKKGVVPEYFELKNGEIVPYKGRNTRQARIAPKKNYIQMAETHIPKSTKVKPGYKKKRKAEVEKLAKTLKRNDEKKRWRRSRWAT